MEIVAGLAEVLEEERFIEGTRNSQRSFQGTFEYLNYDDRQFSVAVKLADVLLSLPMHPYLGDSDLAAVCGAVKEYIER